MSDFTAEKIARAYLMRAAEPPAPELAAFVNLNGPIEAAARVKNGTCPPAVLTETAAQGHHDSAVRDLEQAAAGRTRLVTPEDTEWPADQLSDLNGAQGSGFPSMAPPLGLWVRGPALLNDATARAVAIIGSRAATEYGENHASEFAYHLAGHGISIVSGAAYGVAGAAHRGALSADGTTVAVLGCAIDQTYPVWHASLLRSIAASGALVSEYPPGTLPGRQRFAARSRIVAALTAGTVVVEAGRHSGTRPSISAAEMLGRPLMAMPGPVSSALSYRCHALIRSRDAELVTSVDDILNTTGLGEPSVRT